MKPKLLSSIKKHREAILKAELSIKRVQDKCPHTKEDLEVKYHAYGDWYDHEYSASFHCCRCGKYWHADSEKEPKDYRRPATKVLDFNE